jgi:hypothetical protein
MFTTVSTMRVRNSLCTKRPRLRTQYAVEMQQVVFSSMLAFASIVLWASALRLDMMQLLTIDMLVGHILERWLLRIMRSVDPQTYHPGAPIGRIAINQRLRYSLLVCTLVRGYCAAITAAIKEDDNFVYQVQPGWYYAIMPLVYAVFRTCVIDVQMYDQSILHVEPHGRNSVPCAEEDFSISGGSDEETAACTTAE